MSADTAKEVDKPFNNEIKNQPSILNLCPMRGISIRLPRIIGYICGFILGFTLYIPCYLLFMTLIYWGPLVIIGISLISIAIAIPYILLRYIFTEKIELFEIWLGDVQNIVNGRREDFNEKLGMWFSNYTELMGKGASHGIIGLIISSLLFVLLLISNAEIGRIILNSIKKCF